MYVARYLLACTDQMLDRVIVAQEWWRGQMQGPNGSRCLIGHALGGWDGVKALEGPGYDFAAAGAFDRLARRFGLPRAVELVKARAGKVLEARHPSPVRLAVEVGA